MIKRLQLIFLLLLLGICKSWAIVGDSCANPAVANLCGNGNFTVSTNSFHNEVNSWTVGGKTYTASGQDIFYQINLPTTSYQPVSLSAALNGYFNCGYCGNGVNETIYFLWFENSPCSSNPVAVSSYDISGNVFLKDSIYSSYTINHPQSQYYLVIDFDNSYSYRYSLNLGFANNQPLPPVTCSPAPPPYKGQVDLDKSGCYTSANPYHLPLSRLNDEYYEVNTLFPLTLNQRLDYLPINDDNGNGFILSIKGEDGNYSYTETYQSFDKFPYTYTDGKDDYDVAITFFLKNINGASGLKGFRIQVPNSIETYAVNPNGDTGIYNSNGNWNVNVNRTTGTCTWLFNSPDGRGDNLDNNGYSCKIYTFDCEFENLGNQINAWYLLDDYGNDSLACVYGPSNPPRTDCGAFPVNVDNWIPLSGNSNGTGINGQSCGSAANENDVAFNNCNSYPYEDHQDYQEINGCIKETDYYYNYETPDFTGTSGYAGKCDGSSAYMLLSGNGDLGLGNSFFYPKTPSVLAFYDSISGIFHPVDSLGNINYNLDCYNLSIPDDFPPYPISKKNSFSVPLSVPGIYTVLYTYAHFIRYDFDYYYFPYYPDTLIKDPCRSSGKFIVASITGCPPAAAFTLPDTVCATQCINITNATSINATSWQWSFSGGVPSTYSGDTVPPICYSQPGSYAVTLVASNNYGSDTVSKMIRVTNCFPKASFAAADSVYRNACITIANNSSANSTSCQWQFTGGSPGSYAGKTPPTVCYDTAGSYYIKLIAVNTFGSDTLTKTITVNSCRPSAAFNTSADTICKTDCLTLTNNSSANATSWQWSFNSGNQTSYAGQNPPNVCYNTPGNYSIQLIVANSSASDTITKTITVNACNPTAAFAFNDTICKAGCVTFTNNSSVNVTAWQWSFEGGTPTAYTGQTPPTVCYAGAGVFPVKLVVANQYGSDSVTNSIVVNDCSLPKAAFTLKDTICATDCMAIIVDSVNNVTSWNWNFPGGNPFSFNGQAPPNICYGNMGKYNAQLIVGNNYGSDTIYHSITVNDCRPRASFVTKDSICPGDCINISNTSSANTTNWQWLFPGGNPSVYNGQNPTAVCYPAVGQYAVTLMVSNNYGSDTAIQNITVFKYQAGIILSTADTLCQGNTISLSLINNWGPVQWQISDTTDNFSNISSANGSTYQSSAFVHNTYLRVIAGNGNCADTSAIFKINVMPSITGGFSWSILEKEVTFFTRDSLGNALRFYWNFGDGDTSLLANPIHVFGKIDTTYNVCLTVFDGSNCSYSFCRPVTVGVSAVNNIAEQPEITVYPDPVNDYLFVKMKRANITGVELYDLLGRRLLYNNINNTTGEVLKLDVSGLQDGMYYLKVKTDKAEYIRNVVKLR